MFFVCRPDAGIQLASSESKQEVISRLTSGELLPTDEIFDTAHKIWLPLSEWLAIASPVISIQPPTETEIVLSQPQDTVQTNSQPTAATRETVLPSHTSSTSTALPSYIGKYPIIRVIGSGGMGTVFEAVHPLTEEKVAIKVIHPYLSSQPNIKSLFLKVAKAAIEFTQRSPHLVSTKDVDEDNGKLFQVQEYIEWDTLLKSQDDIRALGWKEVLELYKQLAQGLVALHQEKVIHRDLKPSNVFIKHHNNQWNIKLADFGLSLSEGSTDTQHSVVKQAVTSLYMSPEQRKGEPCTNASDIYSLGIMLYETLTGEKVQGKYDPATEFIQDLPNEVDKIIDACVATNPKKRIQDANQLIAELQAILTNAEREQARIIQEAKRAQREAIRLAKRSAELAQREAEQAQREAEQARIAQVAEQAKRKAEQLTELNKKVAEANNQPQNAPLPNTNLNTIVGEVEREDGQKQKPSPVIQLPKKHRSTLTIALAILVLLAIGIGALNKVLKTSNYAKLTSTILSNNLFIFNQSEQEQLREAADSGDSTAQSLLAICLAKGRGGFVNDDVEAIKWFRKSAKAGNSTGMFYLGCMYEQGRGGLDKDDEVAVEWFQKSAEAGNSTGMCYLGCMYEQGRGGLGKDNFEAVKWYRKSAEAGNSDGMACLGRYYENVEGEVRRDNEAFNWHDIEAVNWYRKAAEAGNSTGMNYLASMYEQGRGGLGKDDFEAVRWYRKSAEAGNSDSMNRLGMMYENGRGGLVVDDFEAVKWYRKSAEAGNSSGMFNFGNMYEQGRGGLGKDKVEALKWFKKSAEAGNSSGMFKLETTDEQGQGAPP
jgi:TPR repeat protein